MFTPTYFDWNATAPLEPMVREAMMPWLTQRFGNASSRHEYGRQARAAIDDARMRIAATCGAHSTEIIFTSGGSEANNLFIKGAAACLKSGVLAVSAIEHPCVSESARQLCRQGWSLERIGVDEQGVIAARDWQRVLTLHPKIISVMLANNESGVIQDIPDLAEKARKAGACFHTDAVQAFGRIPVDFRKLGVNAMTISGHKLGGSVGIGALIIDKQVEISPLIAGGGQERGLRSGTENVAAIVGFSVACELALSRMKQDAQRLSVLSARLGSFLRTQGCRVFSDMAARLPNTVFFSSPGFDGETLVAKLDRVGFACASGSACSSASPGISQTLLAMGVEAELARGAVRISLGHETGEEDISRFMQVYSNVIQELKTLTAVTV